MNKLFKSHGNGTFLPGNFKSIGANVVFEKGVLVFHPENISLHDNIYVGHNTILKGYYKNEIIIRSNTWIGQDCFLHGAGGIEIGYQVGIGPKVSILTSQHSIVSQETAVMSAPLEFSPVILEDGCDIGVGSIILPGVQIGKWAIIGAGSVVTKNVPSGQIWAGNPAKFIRSRKAE
jgi:acetyltransferase-like isoleucine patch superfamily enzyme